MALEGRDSSKFVFAVAVASPPYAVSHGPLFKLPEAQQLRKGIKQGLSLLRARNCPSGMVCSVHNTPLKSTAPILHLEGLKLREVKHLPRLEGWSWILAGFKAYSFSALC